MQAGAGRIEPVAPPRDQWLDDPIGWPMSPRKIQRFEKEILNGQAVPPELRALLDVAVSDRGIDPLREAPRWRTRFLKIC